MNLDTFTRIVRPTRVVALSDTSSSFKSTEDPVLFYGYGEAAIDAFEKVAARVGWGSALVVDGLPTPTIHDVDRLEGVARRNKFIAWYRGTEMPGFSPQARSWVKQDYDGNAYGTHLEVLLEVVGRTDGPVLELGAGVSSTPALHAACEGRLLVTVESDQKWLETFLILGNTYHILECLANPAETTWLDRDWWSVVFIDHAPGGTRRDAIARARSRTEYCVCHDTEELGYDVEGVLATFAHRRDHRRRRPWTTVVSMTREIS